MHTQSLFAAIDLGSNSFRLEIGQLDAGHMRRVEYIKETVRQGNGLDEDRNLTLEAMQRGWDCLARFGERIAGFKPSQVRAVATQTLREARNREVFLDKAKNILGFPIEVIAGREEARLIYLGVSHLLPQSNERRLVIDIGGRSTELILGHNADAQTLESYRVGSVAWSMKYFGDGLWTHASFKAAEIAAKAVLDEAQIIYRRDSWDTCYGSSGTVGAVADVLTQAGWPAGVIQREGLDWLKDRLLKAQKSDNLRLDGIKEDRKPVIGGGLAILRSLFDLLHIDEMFAAQGALRHGALFDLLDRESPQTDVRAKMVQWLTQKFGVDVAQANRVSGTAQSLLSLFMPDTEQHIAARRQRKLHWASQLHEVGMQISHSDYHKHGAYILDNTDLPGFTMDELHRLSQLVLGHRGKLRKLEAEFHDPMFVQQLMALRLAVIFCHTRKDPDITCVQVHCDVPRRTTQLTVNSAWAEQWPQSAHLLREETVAWQKTGWAFHFEVL
ncbi:Ppx/GppA phosphatase family protein [Limnohabitans planktonicus]|uniref:Exopolyphosphatase n=1 Tax=Limnohabitans planktonicus II-D5 TaxID=1293045 RepID=A0A2T7UBL0_9BURK|nr:Ppx/GppA phosphatase family protein [Limnohabitans planktonicus]PVE42105.1 exopolyphosphatase [Limnohabitans planktonicus II-D5]|eukprot:gene2472-2422_t